jgi:hypothetical protein
MVSNAPSFGKRNATRGIEQSANRKKAGNQCVGFTSPGCACPTSTRPLPKLETCLKNSWNEVLRL